VPSAIADPGTTAVWEQALDMIEAGQMTLDTFIAKQSVWVGQLVQQYRGATLAQAAAGAGLPAVRRTDAQRTGKSGAFWSCSATRTARARCRSSPRRPAQRTAQAARCLQGVLILASPAAPATSLAARQTSRTARDSKARVSFCNGVRARLPAIGRRGEKVIAPRIAPAAIPLIGVPCLGHEGLPDALPPREP
jgi:hypothetical protein